LQGHEPEPRPGHHKPIPDARLHFTQWQDHRRQDDPLRGRPAPGYAQQEGQPDADLCPGCRHAAGLQRHWLGNKGGGV